MSGTVLDTNEGSAHSSYEPPRVERVLDSAELAREILYAGQDDFTVHG
jgi:hypothetical protein